MSLKKIFSFAIAAAIFSLGGLAAYRALEARDIPADFFDLPGWSNRAVERIISQNEGISKIAPWLLRTFGAQQRNGVFITEDYLLENISEPDYSLLSGNMDGIKRFLERHNTHTSVALIPTACAIKQQELPSSVSLFNQKQLISDCYGELSGLASTVDAYGRLFAADNQYTYFRTETLPTGLGGYYIYTALISRLGMSPRRLDQFEVEHLPYDYYGPLCSQADYSDIQPDLITLYRFSRYSRQYKLSVTSAGEQKSYYTLFPTHLAELGNPQSVVLGGFGERLDISVASPYEDSILIFADKSALSYLPFLVVHYGNITLIDLAAYPAEKLGEISVEDYDNVLFSYSVDKFMHDDVCSAAALIGADSRI